MKIYTKKGDKGTTSLFGGTRVQKDHIRLESYGTIDELNSWLGLVIEYCDEEQASFLTLIQDYLFRIGSLLATDREKLLKQLPQVPKNAIEEIEKKIDSISEKLPEMKAFILPGGHKSSSYTHIARCVCRRSERLAISLAREENIDSEIIPFLNRLSDYLFVLARKMTFDRDILEKRWTPK